MTNDDRDGTAFPDRREIALDAARIQIAGKGRHHEQRVHIGRDHLLGGAAPGRLARDAAAPLEARFDAGAIGAVVRGNEHPVTDDRQVCRGVRLVAQPPAGFGKAFELAVDRVQAALLLDDPRDAPVAAQVDVHLLFKERRPSKLRESGHAGGQCSESGNRAIE